jgi:phosphoserine phosphatase
MVGGYEEVVSVVVVDLDGTLLRGNSFKLYVRCGACALLRKRSLGGFVRLLAATFLRKLSVITHNRYREICAALIGFESDAMYKMTECAGMSEAVLHFVADRRKEGCQCLLATAALEDYTYAFWEGARVGSVLKDGRVLVDCRGEVKLRRVLEALGGRVPAYALSDDIEDEPLLRYVAEHGGRAVLVNPNKKTLRFFREFEPSKLFDVELLLD